MNFGSGSLRFSSRGNKTNKQSNYLKGESVITVVFMGLRRGVQASQMHSMHCIQSPRKLSSGSEGTEAMRSPSASQLIDTIEYLISQKRWDHCHPGDDRFNCALKTHTASI